VGCLLAWSLESPGWWCGVLACLVGFQQFVSMGSGFFFAGLARCVKASGCADGGLYGGLAMVNVSRGPGREGVFMRVRGGVGGG